ncbi:adenine nucleotide alpha hydrolase family protein [Pedobacter puniceum]|jgi:hypothetical protein|uniref:Universal stress protein n=1 Tax=Pedobacter puniceum TaxID=2666136 RepID=A0A7K0FTZ5_9SPHI|nr:hypothetical protein [Pedobacter puniceum]MRX48810.1 hypothetical protein [Pedobacter puniceum]
MKAIKNILVPTNLSIGSLSVLQYALNQFKGYAFNITLLHVLPLPDAITDLLMLSRKSDENEHIPADFHEAIQRLTLLFPLRISSIKIEHQYGLSTSILSQIIEDKKIDLILHCKTAFKSPTHNNEQKLLKLLDESAYPVMYVPEIPLANVPKTISFILEEDINCVAVLKNMLNQLLVQAETEIRLIAAMPIAKVAILIAQFKNEVDKCKLFGVYKFSIHMLQGENYEESIMQFTTDFEVDMIFLLKKKTFLNRYFINQHILNQTLKQARIPIFTLA